MCAQTPQHATPTSRRRRRRTHGCPPPRSRGCSSDDNSARNLLLLGRCANGREQNGRGAAAALLRQRQLAGGEEGSREVTGERHIHVTRATVAGGRRRGAATAAAARLSASVDRRGACSRRSFAAGLACARSVRLAEAHASRPGYGFGACAAARAPRAWRAAAAGQQAITAVR